MVERKRIVEKQEPKTKQDLKDRGELIRQEVESRIASKRDATQQSRPGPKSDEGLSYEGIGYNRKV